MRRPPWYHHPTDLPPRARLAAALRPEWPPEIKTETRSAGPSRQAATAGCHRPCAAQHPHLHLAAKGLGLDTGRTQAAAGRVAMCTARTAKAGSRSAEEDNLLNGKGPAEDR
jgi:hypothetical protein